MQLLPSSLWGHSLWGAGRHIARAFSGFVEPDLASSSSHVMLHISPGPPAPVKLSGDSSPGPRLDFSLMRDLELEPPSSKAVPDPHEIISLWLFKALNVGLTHYTTTEN